MTTKAPARQFEAHQPDFEGSYYYIAQDNIRKGIISNIHNSKDGTFDMSAEGQESLDTVRQTEFFTPAEMRDIAETGHRGVTEPEILEFIVDEILANPLVRNSIIIDRMRIVIEQRKKLEAADVDAPATEEDLLTADFKRGSL